MEELARLNAMVFDKTGTLTKGSPEVSAVKSFGIAREELMSLAAEVEATSEHHLGKAIINKAEEMGLVASNKPSDVNIMKGHGLQAILQNKSIYIGNKSGAQKLGIQIEPEINEYMIQQEEKGNTAVLVSINNQAKGVISIADQIRAEAPEAIYALKESGINHTVMLTGDNNAVAQKVAASLGIDVVAAELLPEDKVTKVNECKKSGIKLGMVGDGINDAPAIATADVGIAMGGTATDVTMQTADVILMSGNLNRLPYAVDLAKATVRNMKQNTYFALITVALLLVGVLMDSIHLASGMLIHEISVILVILNAVRLVRYPKFQLKFKMPTFKFQFKPLKLKRKENLPACAV